jgi:hypothetical protein
MSNHQDYQEHQVEREARGTLWLDELSDESLAALAEAGVDPRHNRLDALMLE